MVKTDLKTHLRIYNIFTQLFEKKAQQNAKEIETNKKTF